MLTISINASLAPVLLRKLGLTSPEKLEERVTVFFEKKVQGQARAMFATQSDTQQFSDVPRASVEKLLPDVWGGDAGHGGTHPGIEASSSENTGYTPEQETQMYREAFLRNVRREYWKDIEEGTLPKTGRMARILLYSVEYALLRANKELGDWDIIKYKSKEMELCPCINTFLGKTWPFKNNDWVQSVFPSKATQDVWKTYLALCFIEAHKTAQKKVPEFLTTVEGEEVAETERFSEKAIETVKEESESEVKIAQEFLDELVGADGQAVKRIRIRMVAAQLLHSQSQKVNKYVKHGILDDKGASILLHEVHHQNRKLADANYFDNPNRQGAH